MVPAWITTSLSASTLSAQLSSGQVMVELGALVEGLSDVGFRNTLSSAKREAQIRLPQNEVFHALTAATGSAQALGGGVAAASPQPAPSANSFFVQPGAAHGQPSQVEAAPQSMFASQPAAPQQSPAPLFAAAAPADPGLNQPPSQPFTPKFGASLNPFNPSQPASAPTAAPSLFTPPPAEPAAPQQAVPSLFAPTPAASPAPSLFQTFGAPPAASAFAGQPTAQPTGSLVAAPKPFDPFASTGQLATAKPPTDSGFSSAQLLGQMPPAASQPSANSPLALQPPSSSHSLSSRRRRRKDLSRSKRHSHQNPAFSALRCQTCLSSQNPSLRLNSSPLRSRSPRLLSLRQPWLRATKWRR
jgi:hypothetical protein